MLVIDTVKKPRNNYDAFKQWQNWMQSNILSSFGKKIWVQQGEFSLADFKSGDHYRDGNGDYITKEEAQDEVDFLNGR